MKNFLADILTAITRCSIKDFDASIEKEVFNRETYKVIIYYDVKAYYKTLAYRVVVSYYKVIISYEIAYRGIDLRLIIRLFKLRSLILIRSNSFLILNL